MNLRFFLPLCGLTLFGVSASAEQPPSLRDAFKDHFLIGAALNASQFAENSQQAALIREQFNSITPENAMKWDALQPEPGRFRFDTADRYAKFGTDNGMFVIGHTLVWHSQTPAWVFQDAQGQPADRETLLQRMREHIRTVVGRYKGRVKGWDVVNEALAEDGSLRDSPWRRIIGEDYIAQAFAFAHEADPEAELYYNDYGIEGGRKRDGALALLKKLKAAGVHVTGVGLQNHVSLQWPPVTTLDEAIGAFGALGLKVMATELDIDVLPRRESRVSADISRTEAADPALNPYVKGLPDEVQQALARRYAELFGVYLKHRDVVSRVTFWGVTDRDSWLNNFPIRGRTAHPLLFDREGRSKPAFDAVIKAAEQSSRPDSTPRSDGHESQSK